MRIKTRGEWREDEEGEERTKTKTGRRYLLSPASKSHTIGLYLSPPVFAFVAVEGHPRLH